MSDNPEYERIHFATITDDVFKTIPSEYVLQFKSIRTDRMDDDLFKDDKLYQELKKNHLKAKKDFENYKFDKRNNHKY